MRLTIGFTLFLSMVFSFSGAQNYAAALIPDSLKQDSHAVYRLVNEEIELYTANTGTRRIKKVITVLDQNGDGDAFLSIPYDRDSKVQFRQVNIYDKTGKRVKKIKQSELMDIPAYDGASLYSDNRRFIYKPNFGDYPYSVEYEYDIDCKNMITYGGWSPFEGYNASVELARLTFIHPVDFQFKKKETNLVNKSLVANTGNKATEIWELKNIKAIESEPYGISIKEKIPVIYMMPVTLVFDKHIGTSRNWQEYGKWVYDLYDGRAELAEAEKIKITALLATEPDTLQKIQKLYAYMQERTRYVGIQLGIGGYQPFPAQSVFDNGYGDCKALTNYMYSLLRQIGIASYPALVSSGKYIEPIFTDFPNFSQFDHVILSVPFKKDTIWLECTNQTIPFGFLGDFTDDRDVLLITKEGGKFAHTKKYTAQDNLRTGNAEFDIDVDGTAYCSIQTKFKGLQYDQIVELLTASPEDQRKWMLKNSELPSMVLNRFSIKNDKQKIPEATIYESSISRNYCSFTGNYMILPLNMINTQGSIQKMVKERTTDFMIPRSTIDYDTLVYKIPSNFKMEFLPAGKNIHATYGEYSSSVKVVDKKIVFTRMFQLNQGRYNASQYKDFYEFVLSVSKADNVKAMLVKAAN
jgi:hypothetical protein